MRGFTSQEAIRLSEDSKARRELAETVQYPEVAAIGTAVLDDEQFVQNDLDPNRSKELAQRLLSGANNISTGLTGGYYEGNVTNEDGTSEFDPSKVRIERWVRASKYGNPDKYSDTAIPVSEQIDYVRGYLGRHLSLAADETNFDGVNRTISILALLENKKPHEIVGEYLDAVNTAATRLGPDNRVSLDHMIQSYGYMWDNAKESYVIPEEPALA